MALVQERKKDKSSFILSPVSKTSLLLSGYHKVNEFL